MPGTIELGFQGLGKMGLNMVRRLRQGDHRVVCYGRTASKEGAVREVGGEWASSLEEVVDNLARPRIMWMMVPADVVDESIANVGPLLEAGDIVVDGGNSNYKETIRRAEGLAEDGIDLVDVGTSGGVWGLKVGYCLMVGGPPAAFSRLEPALATLAPPDGYLHVGPVGAGHFVKMVHNGIEYGIMEAYAEGFELMLSSDFGLPLREIAHLWNQGSVIRSWLLELAEDALAEDAELSGLRGYVEDSGEGRWLAQESIEKGVPMPIIVHSLMRRFASRQDDSYAMRMLAALRNQFGGHAMRSAEGEQPDD
jgi:6-phosphogluconate dehydrogenase